MFTLLPETIVNLSQPDTNTGVPIELTVAEVFLSTTINSVTNVTGF